MDEKKEILLPNILTVRELADAFGIPVTRVIQQLLKNGVLASMNDNIDYETAAVVADDLGFEVSQEKTDDAVQVDVADNKIDVDGEPRAPIVTVMGHVDHGKTSLLDYIRSAKVAEGESGGITQHIGAYQVDYKGRDITFLDTPGHEAFSTIRAQGTKVTDIVILIVAADEGIKPQTIEAIELIRASGVPFVTAITKVDKPEANVARVEQELAAHNIITPKWGGKDTIVGVSGKTGEGVDELLDLVLLTADLQDLKARKEGPALGVVIESKQDPKVGIEATVIVQQGLLKVGDPFVIGEHTGKVRSMEDDRGKRIKMAGPATPVRMTGFAHAPSVGEAVKVVASDKEAKQMALKAVKAGTVRKATVKTSDLSRLASQIKASHSNNISIVLKADVQGSLEAIKNQLAKIKTDKGSIQIIFEGLGNIAEHDVLAAAGKNAFVVGFRVNIGPSVASIAKRDDIKILTYDVIYELTDDLTKILLESIEPEKVEVEMGEAMVLKVFRDTKTEKIIGMKMVAGKARSGNEVSFWRDKQEVGKGVVNQIHHLADKVEAATAGDDFGFEMKTDAKVQEGDKATFKRVEYRKVDLQE
ncbi:MAG: translation initiation factor IF-2 [Patescibacteria group bacterium]|nr:translation initiation factor IF-2 [Patescibacteria group bacterium]